MCTSPNSSLVVCLLSFVEKWRATTGLKKKKSFIWLKRDKQKTSSSFCKESENWPKGDSLTHKSDSKLTFEPKSHCFVQAPPHGEKWDNSNNQHMNINKWRENKRRMVQRNLIWISIPSLFCFWTQIWKHSCLDPKKSTYFCKEGGGKQQNKPFGGIWWHSKNRQAKEVDVTNSVHLWPLWKHTIFIQEPCPSMAGMADIQFNLKFKCPPKWRLLAF